MFWGDADGGNEKLGAAVNDDGYKFIELAFSVIVADA
jgi:hypothetical protein